MSVDHAYTRCGEHALISCNHNTMHTTPHICEPRRELPPHHTTGHRMAHRRAPHGTRHRTEQRWRGHVSRSGGLMYRMVSPHGLSIVLIRMPPLSRSRSHPSPRLLPSRSAHHSARPHAPRALILMPALSHATAPNISISPLRARPPYARLTPSSGHVKPI